MAMKSPDDKRKGEKKEKYMLAYPEVIRCKKTKTENF